MPLKAQSKSSNSDVYNKVDALERGFYTAFKEEDKSKKRGLIYANKSGAEEIVLDFKYESIFLDEVGNRIVAEQDGKWGIYDLEGRKLGNQWYDDIGYFADSVGRTDIAMVCVYKDEKWGLVDNNGKAYLPCEYDAISIGKSTKVICSKAEQHDFFEPLIQEFSPTNFEYFEPFTIAKRSDPRKIKNEKFPKALAKQNGKWFIINKNGEQPERFSLTRRGSFEIEDKTYTKVHLNGKEGYANTKSFPPEILIPFIYDEMESNHFSDETIIVRIGEQYGLINYKNELIIPIEQDGIVRHGKHFYVTNNHLKELYASDGTKLSDMKFDSIQYASEGLICVGKNARYGFINEQGELVIPIQYDKAQYFRGGRSKVSYRGKHGYINPNNEIIIPIIYESIKPSYNFYIFEKGDSKGVLDRSGKTIIEGNFFRIERIVEKTKDEQGKWSINIRRSSGGSYNGKTKNKNQEKPKRYFALVTKVVNRSHKKVEIELK